MIHHLFFLLSNLSHPLRLRAVHVVLGFVGAVLLGISIGIITKPYANAQANGFIEDMADSPAFEPSLMISPVPQLNQATSVTLSVPNVAQVGPSTVVIHVPNAYSISGTTPTAASQESIVGGYTKVTWHYQPVVNQTTVFAIAVTPVTASDEFDSVSAFVTENTVGLHDPAQDTVWAQTGVPGQAQPVVLDDMPAGITVNDDPRFGQSPNAYGLDDRPLSVEWTMTSINPAAGTVQATVSMTNTINSSIIVGQSLALPQGWSIISGTTPQVFSIAPSQTRQFIFNFQAATTPGPWSASLLLLLDSATTGQGYPPYFVVQEGSTAPGGTLTLIAQTRYLQPTAADQASHGITAPTWLSPQNYMEEPGQALDADSQAGLLALQQAGGTCAIDPAPTCCPPLILIIGTPTWFSSWQPTYGTLIVAPQVTVSGHITLEGFHNPWSDWQGPTTYDGTDLRVRILPAPGKAKYLLELRRGLSDLSGNYKFCIPIMPGSRNPNGKVPIVVEATSADTAELGENPDRWTAYSGRAFKFVASEGGETRRVWRHNLAADLPVPLSLGTSCWPTVPQGGPGLLAKRPMQPQQAMSQSNGCECVAVTDYSLPDMTIGRDNASGFFITSFIADNIRGFMFDMDHYGVCIHQWQANGRGFPVTTFNPAPGVGTGRLPNGQGRIWFTDTTEWDMWAISHEWAHHAHDVISPNGIGHTRLAEGVATVFATVMEEQTEVHKGWRGKPRRNQATSRTKTDLEGHTGIGGTNEWSLQNYRDMGAYFWDLEDNEQDVLVNCTTNITDGVSTPTLSDILHVLSQGPQSMTAYYNQWIADYGDTPTFGAVSLNHRITQDPEPSCVP